MIKKLSIKLFASVIFMVALQSVVVAQKLPNVQDKSVWSAVPLKADGKIVDEVFNAVNKSTLLSYTMSNDDKNLYLVIKSTDNINNNKIMMGGITLTINKQGKKKEKEGFLITYPVIERRQGQRGGGAAMRASGSGQTPPADSAILARKRQLLASAKEIKVSGFLDIPDSLISIYNEFDILAAANFDKDGNYAYELSIPLKLLALDLNSNEFAYNIKVNGIQFNSSFANRASLSQSAGASGGGGGGRGGGFSGGGQGVIRGGFDPSAFLPTDFWGKYKLARK